MRRSDRGRAGRARWLLLGALALCATLAAQSLPPALVRPAAQLAAPAREELQEHRAALAAMDATARDDFRQRIAEWNAQPPTVRRARREQWQAWQAMPATERARLEASSRAFAALPADQQLALRTRFDALDDSERRGWLLGPTLGKDWGRLRPLFAQVPEAQRDALLAVLRGLPDAARADLAVLAQRVPPQDRATLRTQLLSTPAGARAQWLRERLER